MKLSTKKFLHKNKLVYDLFDPEFAWLWEPIREETPPWQDDEILHLFERVLTQSIKSLFNLKSSRVTVLEVYQWIVDEKIINPFSFSNCCTMSGVDPDDLREIILDRFKKQHRSKTNFH